jgi:hypothetical protein
VLSEPFDSDSASRRIAFGEFSCGKCFVFAHFQSFNPSSPSYTRPCVSAV